MSQFEISFRIFNPCANDMVDGVWKGSYGARPVHRTALITQMRGFLLDRGIAFAKSATRARRMIPLILEDADNGLTPLLRETITELSEFLQEVDRRISVFDHRIDQVFQNSEACQRISQLEGVGPKTATALVAAVGDAKELLLKHEQRTYRFCDILPDVDTSCHLSMSCTDSHRTCW